MEECDNFQGFQLLFDMYPGGFAAVATSLGQLLHDDYKKPMIVFPTIPPLSNEELVCIVIYIVHLNVMHVHIDTCT